MATVTFETVPSPVHISMVQGDRKRITVTITVDGGPLDLENYDIRYEVPDISIVKDIDEGTILCDDYDSGEFYFYIEPEETATLEIEGPRAFAHGCRIQSPDGGTYTLFYGWLAIRPAPFTQMDSG